MITFRRYGANITTVCESEAPVRNLSGETLTTINDAMTKKVHVVVRLVYIVLCDTHIYTHSGHLTIVLGSAI